MALYCHNELLGTAETVPPPQNGNIGINFGTLNHKTYVTDIRIKTK